MSLETLPNELQNLIFSSIHPKTSSPTFDSQKAFCSLALTSKRFLPLAREYLYSQPLSNARISWRKAKAIFQTFSTTDLGHLVSSLDGIAQWRVTLEYTSASDILPFQLDSFTKASSWYFTIIKLCPQLESVDIAVATSRQLARLLEDFESSSITLKRVVFGNTEQTRWNITIPSSLAHSALSHPALRHVESVTYRGPYTITSPSSNTPPSVSLPLKDVVIRSHVTRLEGLKHYLPANPSTLLRLEISLRRAHRGTGDFLWILDYAPRTLIALAFRAVDSDLSLRPSLTRYRQLKTDPNISIRLFPPFPNLKTLDLAATQGPSLDFLQQLLVSSPLLVNLSFSRSWWILSPSNASIDPSASYQVWRELVFPRQQVIDVLLNFRFLHFVDLGYLPSRRRRTYSDLELKLKEAGVETVLWIECRPTRCRQCGQVH